MTSTRLDGKRVLLTQANDFMGPALTEVFRDSGAEVIADTQALDQDPALPAAMVRAAGRVDVLLVHLALPAPSTPVGEISDVEWRTVFAHLVDPLPRLVSAVLPQMLERGSGRILVMGSAAALRGQKRTGTYSAARGAQLSYVQAVALELVQHGSTARQAGKCRGGRSVRCVSLQRCSGLLRWSGVSNQWRLGQPLSWARCGKTSSVSLPRTTLWRADIGRLTAAVG